MKLVACLPVLALAACGAKAAGPSPITENTAAPAVAPYAPLFIAATTWRFQVESEHSAYDPANAAADPEGYVYVESSDVAVCTVARVGSFPGGQLGEITCDDAWPSDVGQDAVTGVWASTERGLWRLEAWPADGAAPDLADDQMIMGAEPVARTTEERDPEFPDPVHRTVLEQKGDTWCWSEAAVMGDEAWASVCFGAGGITSGSMGWAGGSVHEATFTLAP